jgi:mitogen-activated protein kinase 1/3
MFTNPEAEADPSKLQTLYIVTSYEEIDMSKIMGKKVELTTNMVKTIAYNLLISLRYLHKACIIHRDLKPNNILINLHCQVQICDFGWSRTTTSKVKLPANRKARSLSPDFCNRFYRPPEVIIQTKEYDSRVDIWSYGCIIADLIKTVHSKSKSKYLFMGDSCYPSSPYP